MLTNLLVPTFTQMLTALSAWLSTADRELAESHADDGVLTARLAPDMFPLTTQVRFACVQAYEAVARLTDTAMPGVVATMLSEGRDGGERPGTIAHAQARIADTLAMLAALAPDALDIDPATPLAHALPNGMTFDLSAERYARDWALAQFYFHVMTAYAILRAQGVTLGKRDFIPHMLPFLRATGA